MKFTLLKQNLLFFTLMSFYASCGQDIFDDKRGTGTGDDLGGWQNILLAVISVNLKGEDIFSLHF